MNAETVSKSLKWLMFNFPMQDHPEDDSDRMCNCIHLYCEQAVFIIDQLTEENKRLAEIVEKFEQNPVVRQVEIPMENLLKCEVNGVLFYEIEKQAIDNFTRRLNERALLNNPCGGSLTCKDVREIAKLMKGEQ